MSYVSSVCSLVFTVKEDEQSRQLVFRLNLKGGTFETTVKHYLEVIVIVHR